MSNVDGHLIDLRDYAEDPLTKVMLELDPMAATWPADVRDEVVETLGGLAILCATRGAPVHAAAAEFLSVERRLIRLAGEAGTSTQTTQRRD